MISSCRGCVAWFSVAGVTGASPVLLRCRLNLFETVRSCVKALHDPGAVLTDVDSATGIRIANDQFDAVWEDGQAVMQAYYVCLQTYTYMLLGDHASAMRLARDHGLEAMPTLAGHIPQSTTFWGSACVSAIAVLRELRVAASHALPGAAEAGDGAGADFGAGAAAAPAADAPSSPPCVRADGSIPPRHVGDLTEHDCLAMLKAGLTYLQDLVPLLPILAKPWLLIVQAEEASLAASMRALQLHDDAIELCHRASVEVLCVHWG